MVNSMTLERFKKSFRGQSLAEFCCRRGICYLRTIEERLNGHIDLERFTDEIEAQGVSYFYASYCETDIWQAFQDEPHVPMSQYEFIRLEDGLCIAVLGY